MLIGICDDDAFQREYLSNLCNEVCRDLSVDLELRCFTSGEELLSYDQEELALLFLDIELNDYDGTEMLKTIEKMNNIWRVVFVSSHSEKVFSTFGIKTLDFGVKPVNYSQVERWLRIAIKEFNEDELIKFEQFNNEMWIKKSEILYISSDGNYINIHTTTDTKTTSRSMKYWQGVLDDEVFVRIHRTYLVNMMHVKEVENTVILSNDEELPLGRLYRKSTLESFNKYMMKLLRGRSE